MQKSKIFITSLIAGVLTFSVGCTDDFGEVNTNPNKVYAVELGDVWPGTVKRSMDFIEKLNFEKLFNFSRSVVVQAFSNANQDTGDSNYNTFYVEIMRDLTVLEKKYSADPEMYANRLGIVKTWKSYMYYIMVSMYGPIPMSDAINDGSGNKRTYNYDSELEIYTTLLDDLTKAYDMMKNAGPEAVSAMNGDPIFGDGSAPDMDKWIRFANSLRLNIAMHIENVDPELSRTMALEALDGDLIISNDGNVCPRYGTTAELSHSYYYGRCIYNRTSFSKTTYPAMSELFYMYLHTLDDPRLSRYFSKCNDLAPAPNASLFTYTDTIVRQHKCYNKDGADYKKCPLYSDAEHKKIKNQLRDSIEVELMSFYEPLHELAELANDWEWAIKPGSTNNTRYTALINKGGTEYTVSYVQLSFLDEQSSLPLFSYADVCFLKAEALLKYKGDRSGARAAYEEGIMASMAQYGVNDYASYMHHPGVEWGTDIVGCRDERDTYRATITGSNGDDGLLEQIIKQRYIADMMIPLEQWNVERRTRMFNFPPYLLKNSSPDIEGVNLNYNYWTERLIYPNDEYIKNREGVNGGITKLQASSPYTRSERNGDNVFTSLAFAKKQPGIETADEVWGKPRTVTPAVEYYLGQWGSTYEEVVANAKQYTGKAVESAALKDVGYKWTNTISTFDPNAPVTGK